MIKKLIVSIILCCYSYFTNAQTTFNTSAIDVISSEGSVTSSFGQTFYNSENFSSGSYQDGIQYPENIFSLNINSVRTDMSISVYPNPVKTILNLKISNSQFEQLSYQLYDMQGVLHMDGDIDAKYSKLNFDSLATGLYVLRILNNPSTNVKSIKIIKL